jgi:hypothetical protein
MFVWYPFPVSCDTKPVHENDLTSTFVKLVVYSLLYADHGPCMLFPLSQQGGSGGKSIKFWLTTVVCFEKIQGV